MQLERNEWYQFAVYYKDVEVIHIYLSIVRALRNTHTCCGGYYKDVQVVHI
jgi:hypothetical protein